MTRPLKFWHHLLCVLILCFGFTLLPSSRAEVVRTGYTTIAAANSGKCLDIALSNPSSGAPANQRPCTFAGNQELTVSAATQGFQYDFKIIEQQTG